MRMKISVIVALRSFWKSYLTRKVKNRMKWKTLGKYTHRRPTNLSTNKFLSQCLWRIWRFIDQRLESSQWLQLEQNILGVENLKVSCFVKNWNLVGSTEADTGWDWSLNGVISGSFLINVVYWPMSRTQLCQMHV